MDITIVKMCGVRHADTSMKNMITAVLLCASVMAIGCSHVSPNAYNWQMPAIGKTPDVGQALFYNGKSVKVLEKHNETFTVHAALNRDDIVAGTTATAQTKDFLYIPKWENGIPISAIRKIVIERRTYHMTFEVVDGKLVYRNREDIP